MDVMEGIEAEFEKLRLSIEVLTEKINSVPVVSTAPIAKKSTVESVFNVVSIALIPIVLAVGGWFIQKSLQNQSIQRDYVQLSVSILKSSDTGKISVNLRDWAVRLLDQNSPVELNDIVKEQLTSGQISFPNDSAVHPNYGNTAQPLDSLQPKTMALAKKLISVAKAQGIEVTVLRTRLTSQQQAIMEELAIGSDNLSDSTYAHNQITAHVQGLAFDMAPSKNGVILYDDNATLEKLGKIATALGLFWGGTGTHKDYTHFELKQ